MPKEMMSAKEVAEYLNINEKLVYRLVKEKKIPGTKVTGKWTFPRRLIDEWIIESAKENVGLKVEIRALKDHIVIMGSNDFSIELLSHELGRQYPEYSLSFSNVGSLEGLIALSRGNCHLAGCHLFDPDTGEYNFPYISRYLPGMSMSTRDTKNLAKSILSSPPPAERIRLRGVLTASLTIWLIPMNSTDG